MIDTVTEIRGGAMESIRQRPWYDPLTWPDFVRWLAIAPLMICGGVIYYIVYAIANSGFGDLPNALVQLFGAAFASGLMVAIAIYIAPRFREAVAATVIGLITILAVALTVKTAVAPVPNVPMWYEVLFAFALVFGSLVGQAINPKHDDHPARLETGRFAILRWIIALPAAIILALLGALTVALLSMPFRLDANIVLIWNTLLCPIFFGAALAYILPKAKRTITTALLSLFVIYNLVFFVSGVFRVQLSPIVAHSNSDLVFIHPQWVQILLGLAGLIGSAIVTCALFRRERPRESAARS